MLNTLKKLVLGCTMSSGAKIMTDGDRPLVSGTKDVDWEAFDKLRESHPICIDHSADMVSFKLMTKPVSEGGTGCQHVDMIEMGKNIIEYFTREEEKKLEKLTEDLKGPFDSDEASEKLHAEYNNTKTSYDCNKKTVLALAAALHQQMVRTSDRTLREVEGTSKS